MATPPVERSAREPAAVSAAQAGWMLVGILLVIDGSITWGLSLNVAGAALVGPAVMATGLIVGVRTVQRGGTPGRRSQLAVLAALIAVTAYHAFGAYFSDPRYGTDSVAFNQYSAQLITDGVNPYTASMRPALEEFQTPSYFRTFRIDGTQVDSLSYPAGAVLPYVIPVALGARTQLANIVDLLAWLASMLVLWRLLPARSRWAAPLLLGLTNITDYIIGGGTDALWVPWLILALWRWDRFGDPDEPSAARWLGPIALGVAVATKQTPWPFFPFLLVGLAIEARRRGVRIPPLVGRYAATTAAVFTIINLPFIVMAPGAWSRAVLLPITQPLIPDGQGVINLTFIAGLGGGALLVFQLVAVAALAALLFALVAWPGHFVRTWPLLVAGSFLLATRSYTTYALMPLPAALLALETVRPPAATAALRQARVASLGCVTLAVVLLAVALTRSPPLRMDVLSFHSTGQLQTIDQVTVRVTNATGNEQRPQFSIYFDGRTHMFWYPIAGGRAVPFRIGPHAAAVVTLRAPDVSSMIPLRKGFKVEAFTEHPNAVSTAPSGQSPAISVVLSPTEVPRPVPAQTPITVVASLRGKFGGRARRAGVRIALSQVIYQETALLPGTTSINRRPEGMSPVVAVTDAAGRATFRIVPAQGVADPVFFQAWIAPRDGVPHGYSNQVAVQIAPAARASP